MRVPSHNHVSFMTEHSTRKYAGNAHVGVPEWTLKSGHPHPVGVYHAQGSAATMRPLQRPPLQTPKFLKVVSQGS